jgi:GNAT superfamily N-acetyltransferase
MTTSPQFRTADQPVLPEGYYFVDPYEAQPLEITALDQSVNGLSGSWIRELDWPDVQHQMRTYVGVRALIDNTLVGLGLLEENDPQTVSNETVRSGDLGYMMVHPDHRHKGIGKALILERIRLARLSELGKITTLLMTTNSLRPFYQELGFRAVDSDSDDFELTIK